MLLFQRSTAAMLLAAVALVALLPQTSALPDGFTDELVTSMDQVMSLTFLPDGRMIIGAS